MRWYVIGEGAEEDNLRALIKQNGVEDSFILLGITPNPYPFIAGCDIYSQASRFEGWCIALAESLVLARPVLASKCAGNEEQVTDGETGLLIDLSTDNIVDGMEKLINSPELRKKFTRNLSSIALDFKKDLEMLYALTD